MPAAALFVIVLTACGGSDPAHTALTAVAAGVDGATTTLAVEPETSIVPAVVPTSTAAPAAPQIAAIPTTSAPKMPTPVVTTPPRSAPAAATAATAAAIDDSLKQIDSALADTDTSMASAG